MDGDEEAILTRKKKRKWTNQGKCLKYNHPQLKETSPIILVKFRCDALQPSLKCVSAISLPPFNTVYWNSFSEYIVNQH